MRSPVLNSSSVEERLIDLKPIAILLKLVSKLFRAGAVESASDFRCLVEKNLRSLPRLILFAPSII